MAMNGITTQRAEELLKQFGSNTITSKRRSLAILDFFKQFKDALVIILIIASAVAYFAGEKIDAIIIFGIVLLNATIGFIQEFKAERAIEALKKMLEPKARVLRDGVEQIISIEKLVPGDVIILNEGDKIPADAEVFEANELMLDEALLTGESVPVTKNLSDNKKLFMGTQVTHGTGKAVVTQTGMRTEFGKIANLTSTTKKDLTPLQKELDHIGVFVGKITIVISVVLFLVGFFLYKNGLIETILFSVSVAVAAVPEGLPTTITVALALGVQRLARKNAIVKQLSSVETLGSTTVICSDKTGTLTKNQMTVQEVLLGQYVLTVRGVGYEPVGDFSILNTNGPRNDYITFDKSSLAQLAYKSPDLYEHLQLLSTAALLCNNARLVSTDNENGEAQWSILGDPTEGALVTLAEKAGFTADQIGQQHTRVFEIPFDSNRKRMSVIAQTQDDHQMRAYVKGAPDAMLELCTHIRENGKTIPLTPEGREKIRETVENMAQRALRTIAVGYKDIPHEQQNNYEKEKIEQQLVLIGVFGMIDPPRDEVKEAVKLTHKAGIRVFIITGDHGLTAHAIAKELGIVKSYGVNIVTGDMLNAMTDTKLLSMVAPGQETIFARVSPEHKLRIVDALKRSGEVVAVTGDGVNDAPALKRADIGVAMGITGTDVSKEAANMVLTDDSFGTIVSAIIEGRTIYENMRKFISFIFASNIGELVAIFVTIMIGLPAPLSAVLILIINTLTDVFPSLALGVEPVEKNVLEKKPRNPNSRIMERPFIIRCFINGGVIGLVTVGVFVWNLSRAGWHFGESLSTDSTLYYKSATMAFVMLTLMQMVHAFNNRSETVSVFRMNPLTNPALIGAVLFSILGTVALVEIPVLQTYFKTVSLSGMEWLALVLLSFAPLIPEEIRKRYHKL